MGEAGCEHQLVSSQPVSYSELGLPTTCWMACSTQVWKGLTLAGWRRWWDHSCPALGAVCYSSVISWAFYLVEPEVRTLKGSLLTRWALICHSLRLCPTFLGVASRTHFCLICTALQGNPQFFL